jgi:hypothetical protein
MYVLHKPSDYQKITISLTYATIYLSSINITWFLLHQPLQFSQIKHLLRMHIQLMQENHPSSSPPRSSSDSHSSSPPPFSSDSPSSSSLPYSLDSPSSLSSLPSSSNPFSSLSLPYLISIWLHIVLCQDNVDKREEFLYLLCFLLNATIFYRPAYKF